MGIREAGKDFSKHLSVYTYDLSNQKNTDKVRFVYALKGRKKEAGLIKAFKGRFLAPGCFIIPINKDEEMQQILKRWDVRFKRMEILAK